MFNNQYLIRIMEIDLLHERYLVILFDLDNCLLSVLDYLFSLLHGMKFPGESKKLSYLKS